MNKGRFQRVLQTVFRQLKVAQILDKDRQQPPKMLPRGKLNGLPRGVLTIDLRRQGLSRTA